MEAVPPDVAVLLEKATGVDRSEFRPDLWPRARWKAVKRAVRG
jgi:DNA-binding transcriptional regulator YdaS (Cro superfamily)